MGWINPWGSIGSLIYLCRVGVYKYYDLCIYMAHHRTHRHQISTTREHVHNTRDTSVNMCTTHGHQISTTRSNHTADSKSHSTILILNPPTNFDRPIEVWSPHCKSWVYIYISWVIIYKRGNISDQVCQ